MGKTFDIEYDDFSGGHWAGGVDAKQPKNTWVGDGMIVVAGDGMLMPGAPLVLGVTDTDTTLCTYSGMSVFNGASATLAYEKRRQTGAGAITNTAVYGATTNVVTTNATAYQPVIFGDKVLLGVTTKIINLVDGTTASIVDGGGSAIIDPIGQLYAFGAYLLSPGTSGNRIFFSAIYDHTTWDSNDYIDVGDSGESIRTVISTLSGLMVGTDRGWYQVTGVLGQTTVIRQISQRGVAAAGGANTENGIVFAAGGSPDRAVVRLLEGARTPVVLWDGDHTVWNSDARITPVGNAIFVVSDGTDRVWMWSENTHCWRAIAMPTATNLAYSATPSWRVASDPGASAETAWFLAAGVLASNSDPAVAFHTYEIDPANPPYNSVTTAFTSATADLSGYDHPKQFTVSEVIVEVDCGTTAQNKTRSVGVQMFTNAAIMDYSTSVTSLYAAASTAQTLTLPAMATTAGERVVLRFSPNNGGPTMTATPRITLQGLKMRRCIVRCREVD